MLELPMGAALSNLLPPVLPQHADHVADFHERLVSSGVSLNVRALKQFPRARLTSVLVSHRRSAGGPAKPSRYGPDEDNHNPKHEFDPRSARRRVDAARELRQGVRPETE